MVAIFSFLFYQARPLPPVAPGVHQKRPDCDPVTSFKAYLKDEIDLKTTLIFILAQVLGACVPAYLIIKIAWTSTSYWKEPSIHYLWISSDVWPSSINQV